MSQNELDNMILSAVRDTQIMRIVNNIHAIYGMNTVEFLNLGPSRNQMKLLFDEIMANISKNHLILLSTILEICELQPEYFDLFLENSNFDSVPNFVLWSLEKMISTDATTQNKLIKQLMILMSHKK